MSLFYSRLFAKAWSKPRVVVVNAILIVLVIAEEFSLYKTTRSLVFRFHFAHGASRLHTEVLFVRNANHANTEVLDLRNAIYNAFHLLVVHVGGQDCKLEGFLHAEHAFVALQVLVFLWLYYCHVVFIAVPFVVVKNHLCGELAIRPIVFKIRLNARYTYAVTVAHAHGINQATPEQF